jgi:hypothetical protein
LSAWGLRTDMAALKVGYFPKYQVHSTGAYDYDGGGGLMEANGTDAANDLPTAFNPNVFWTLIPYPNFRAVTVRARKRFNGGFE